MLNELFGIHARTISKISLNFKRHLYKRINWDQRMIIITGARGTGKTTMVLQHYLETYNDIKKCLYISADNPLVLKTGIYNTGSEYFKYYGGCLIVDEVHKQKDWSVDVKALYDAYPDKKFIILGSSTLNILYEKGDLSRRSVLYRLQPLSFREYLELKYQKQLQKLTFSQILSDHVKISGELVSRFKTILGDFNDFLMNGSYPFFLEFSQNEYFDILFNVLDKIIYEDISTLKSLRSFSSLKLKKLLAFIAVSKIPLFNIESLKVEIGVSKDTLYEYFDLLDRAEIVKIIRTESGSMRALKNSKILFTSPNIYYSIAFESWKRDADKGNIRESFFASQIGGAYPLFSSMNTDFLLIDGRKRFEIEVGGKSKKKKQIKNLKDASVFKDGVETGFANSIPLYLAGFIY
ncbi:MAG: AAA family ATPase [Thermodesulfobacteriota bacterium]|nr:AAA family ATPase [Thermodesulfobacteriota bacterium]